MLESHLKLHEEEGRIIIYTGFRESIDKIREVCLSQSWAVLQADGRGWTTYGTPLTPEECLKLMDASYKPETKGCPECPKLVFLAQWAMSTGIELSAARTMIAWSYDNVGENVMQAIERNKTYNSRVHSSLVFYRYVCHPVDELLIDRFDKKVGLQALTMQDIDKYIKIGGARVFSTPSNITSKII